MKIRMLIFAIVALIGCNQSQNSEKKQQIKKEKEKTIKAETYFKFDNSVIPERLVKYVETNLDSLRIPTEKNYDLKYMDSYEITGLPYFCQGNFNGDSLIDYSLVLIKDSSGLCPG